jgi:hypothetical protein
MPLRGGSAGDGETVVGAQRQVLGDGVAETGAGSGLRPLVLAQDFRDSGVGGLAGGGVGDHGKDHHFVCARGG